MSFIETMLKSSARERYQNMVWTMIRYIHDIQDRFNVTLFDVHPSYRCSLAAGHCITRYGAYPMEGISVRRHE